MNKEEIRKEELAEQLHEWYLEACLYPESGTDYNPEAQVLYKNLRESQKFLDRYIAKKIIAQMDSQKKEMVAEIEKQKTGKMLTSGFNSGFNQGLERALQILSK